MRGFLLSLFLAEPHVFYPSGVLLGLGKFLMFNVRYFVMLAKL